jgi:pyridoxal phosphate enzyme (YggS family)
LETRLQAVKERIRKAAEGCQRNPEEIRLIAVSKTMPAETVRQAIEAGVTDIGENYVQESRDKFQALVSLDVNWHFIGHLQSNKAKYVVRIFDLIHSVDSLKLARELSKQAKNVDKVQKILVQVNVAKEDTKSGIYAEDAIDLLKEIGQFENLSVRGLMTMPPFFNAPDRVRPFFADLCKLRDKIESAALPNIRMDALSMGMTGDFETAIEEGATFVRVGTAIFGART